MKNTITYKMNKKNVSFIIVILFLIEIFGFLFIYSPSFFTSTIIRIIGIIFCIISVFFLIGHFTMLFSSYGLKLYDNGLVNNTNLTNVGLILWTDISSIKINKLKKNILILIFIKNEEKYYKNVKNPFKRINLSTYNNFYGTPFVIETRNLSISAEELERILQTKIGN